MKKIFVLFLLFAAPLFAGDWKILVPPKDAGEAFQTAGREFQKYYREITGTTLPIVAEGNDVDDFIVIGSDAVNPFVRQLVERKVIRDFPLKIASDDYRLLSVQDGSRNHLILAGGRGRSTLYAVYDFLERRGNCRWFWDGNVVPKAESLDLTGLDVRESPRFEYRGLRYFAHRGLTRFQAEHWGLEDWKKEIDWIVKKRLNVFMLRIGMDDLFQRAFPEIVDYPDPAKPLPEALGGYDNRSLFWSLQYRGELRKNLLAYAFDRDLMHPEDFGTMSHWYSRTPYQFLEKVKPEFVPNYSGYGHETDLVWDIRKDENLENYWKLTQASIDHYGKPELLHTIGIAERHCYKDREDNLRMKLYAYRRLIDNARRHYPNGKILLAGWDFYNAWTPEEVREFTSQLDPENTILWDYEAEAQGERNFTNWGVVGKFPYTFGIFLAYESALDIRADYPLIEERQKVILNDPMCKGYILWPESSHTDIFLLHYFTSNAWKPGVKSVEELLHEFCADRYGKRADAMESIWKKVLPPSQLLQWGGNFGSILASSRANWNDGNVWQKNWNEQAPVLADAPAIFAELAEIDWDAPFFKRDSIDLARTTADRLLTCARIGMFRAYHEWKAGNVSAEVVKAKAAAFLQLAEGMEKTLALHTDYSLWEAYQRLDAIEKIQNPNFGSVLLENAANAYCRSHQYEVMRNWYLPMMKDLVACVLEKVEKNDLTDFTGQNAHNTRRGAMYQQLLQTSLESMAPNLPRTSENYRKTMLEMSAAAKEILAPAQP
ncbi:MAG: hypothetical protein Q4D98_00400 [Planctomycetia bacterium]|nr:hypothetical protein [Planctomycetia bacterium]